MILIITNYEKFVKFALRKGIIILFFFFLFLPLRSILASQIPTGLTKNESLLIVEVQIVGEKTDNDFIKIYNISQNNLDISGYKLKKRSSTGGESSIRVFPKGSKIGAKEYFVWANSKDDFHLTIRADVWSKSTLAKNNSIALLDPENIIVDALGWGESKNPFVKGRIFLENPGPNQQLKRKKIKENYQNTNDNSQDFYLSPLIEASQKETYSIQKPASFEKKSAKEPNRISEDQKITEPSKIDINTASLKDLMRIVHLGEKRAQELISLRPFYSLDELTKIRGIGKKTLEDIKEQGLAWIDPKLKPPETEKNKSLKNELALIDKPFEQRNFQVPKSFFVFLTALVVAIFSGVMILILKMKLKSEIK